MSRVSYFQRFSQKENHATNNTLLVLRHVYNSSPLKIERALTSLLDAQLSIGLAFEQQVRGPESVPDALISQQGLHIFIETKRGGALDTDQIERHLQGIGSKRPSGRVVLLGLTKNHVGDTAASRFKEMALGHKVLFAAVTFSDIALALKAQCEPYEADLLAVLDDFERYLDEADLAEDRNRWLPILPCGVSLAQNVKFGLYYEPPSRPLKTNDFIGIYARKAVRYVGRVVAVVVCSWKGDELISQPEVGEVRQEYLIRIRQMADETPYYALKEETERFYVTEGFVETEVEKTTPGGIMGPRYLDLIATTEGRFNTKASYTTEAMAELLKGTKFA
jgi:hypothetical protein